MTWFGGPVYLLTAGGIFVAALLLDGWLLYTGRIVHYKLVSHRKLRALAARRKPVTGTLAPCIAPVTGPELRAVGRLSAQADRAHRGAAVRAAEQPQPAPGPLPGAGPRSGPQKVGRDSAATNRKVVDHCYPGEVPGRSPSAGGPQQPAAADVPPDSAAAGPQPHPRDEEVAGATVPRTVAPATLDAGAVAQPAPANVPMSQSIGTVRGAA